MGERRELQPLLCAALSLSLLLFVLILSNCCRMEREEKYSTGSLSLSECMQLPRFNYLLPALALHERGPRLRKERIKQQKYRLVLLFSPHGQVNAKQSEMLLLSLSLQVCVTILSPWSALLIHMDNLIGDFVPYDENHRARLQSQMSR